jgi:hypothetical protein
MYLEKEYRQRCAGRGLDEAATDAALAVVGDLAAEEGGPDGRLGNVGPAAIESFIARRAAAGRAGEDALVALARYFLVLAAADRDSAGAANEVTRLLYSYLSPIGILPAMSARLASLHGEAIRSRVVSGIAFPVPGSPPRAYAAPTAAFVAALERELGAGAAHRVLAWNVHGIPPEAFAGERALFLAAPSIQAWLDGYHARQVAVLEAHAADGSLWFEQRITRRVVEFVRESPEVLGGVVEGGRVLMTKIPYDPDRFLGSGDPLERRRLACHCPLAASSITESGAGVPSPWCSCSAGFEKFLLDVAFGEETRAEVLESVLGGSERCRFAVTIPPGLMSKRI